MTHDLLKHLDTYADGTLDPEIAMEIDGLITRYLDELLDPETAKQIDAAIEALGWPRQAQTPRRDF